MAVTKAPTKTIGTCGVNSRHFFGNHELMPSKETHLTPAGIFSICVCSKSGFSVASFSTSFSFSIEEESFVFSEEDFSCSSYLDPNFWLPIGNFPFNRVVITIIQNIVMDIPTRTSAIKKVVEAIVPQLSIDLPGKNVNGIKLYQPAPKPEIPAKRMSITAASIIQNEAFAQFIPNSCFLPHLLVA